MGSWDSVHKRLDEHHSTDSDDVIVIIPELVPKWGSSTSTASNGSIRNLHNLGKEIAVNDAPMEHETGFEFGKQGGEDADALMTDLSGSGKSLEMSTLIDVKCGDGEEKICRICHLESEPEELDAGNKVKMDFIELGCGCKGDLGYSHSSCASTWFHHRGNRQCEICGKTAENVTVSMVDQRFVEQWNENRVNREEANSSERNGRCWQGQPCCNLLLACLVMSFIIPWLLRIDMF